MVALVEITVDIWQVLVHLGLAVVMAEETPHTGIGIAHILEVDRTIGITEREVGIVATEKSKFACKRNHIVSINAFHFGTVYILQVLAANALVRLFLFLRELPDTAEISVSADAVVGDSQSHPHGTFAAFALAYYLHNPRLVGVADGDCLAATVISVLVNELRHTADSLAGCGRALQSKTHKAEIVEQALIVDKLQPSVESGFHYGDLLFVHQPHHIVGIFHLLHKLSLVRRSPAVDGD